MFLPGANRKILRTIRDRDPEISGSRPTFSTTSHSFIEPSPEAVTSWFSWTSDQARSYSPSCVSYLLPLNLSTSRTGPEQTHCLSRFTASAPAGPGTTEARCRRPFPTRPKLADEASARRVGWKGDHAMEKWAKPGVCRTAGGARGPFMEEIKLEYSKFNPVGGQKPCHVKILDANITVNSHPTRSESRRGVGFLRENYSASCESLCRPSLCSRRDLRRPKGLCKKL